MGLPSAAHAFDDEGCTWGRGGGDQPACPLATEHLYLEGRGGRENPTTHEG